MGKIVSGWWLCLAVLFLMMSTNASSAEAGTEESIWEEPAPIDVPSGGDVLGPSIAMSADGTAMAVWLQAKSEGCPILDLGDGLCPGLVWSNRYVPFDGWATPVLIGELGESSAYVTPPRIAMDRTGRAVALWANDTLWANHFTPGVGWGTPTASPWDLALYGSCCIGLPWSLQVVSDGGGGVLMVWSGWREQGGPGAWAGSYVPSDGWGGLVLLASNAMRPQIAADEAGNTIVTVWMQGEVEDDGRWRSRSIGASRFTPESGWGVPSVYQISEGEVQTDVPNGVQVNAAVAPDGTAVVSWTVYRGSGNWSVWAASLGVNMVWSEGFELEAPRQAPVGLVVDGRGTATVLYTSLGCGYGGRHAFWAARFVPGSGWEEPSLITDAGVCYGVHLVGYAVGHATLVWGAGTSAIWGVQYAPDLGWGTPTRISEEGVNTWFPAIAANPSGDVIVGWMQWTEGGGWWEHKKRIYASQPRPLLTLSSPQDGDTTSVPTVTVAGRTWPGATLVVNGIQAAVAADGFFSFRLALEEGTNTITVMATDVMGRTRTLSMRVTYLNPVHSLEEALQETDDALADAKLDLRETNEALADARSGLAMASQDLFLMFILQFALVASIALLFVLYWQQRRGGPGTILGFSRNRKAATSLAPGRGMRSQFVAADRTHRLTSQPQERPWPKTPAGSPLHLTIKERIALHLLEHTRNADATVVPSELTQDGIAKAAGFNRRHFAQNVRPLVGEGLVQERMAHVEGALQRQKAYALTHDGWRNALGVRDRVLSFVVPVKGGSGAPLTAIGDFVANHRGTRPLLDIIRAVIESGANEEV